MGERISGLTHSDLMWHSDVCSVEWVDEPEWCGRGEKSDRVCVRPREDGSGSSGGQPTRSYHPSDGHAGGSRELPKNPARDTHCVGGATLGGDQIKIARFKASALLTEGGQIFGY